MDIEVTSFINLPVYTHRGEYVGVVQNVRLDLPGRRIGSLLLTRTSPKLIDGGRNVAVPYRWVAAKGDILLLSYFPAHVEAKLDLDAAELEHLEEEPLAATA